MGLKVWISPYLLRPLKFINRYSTLTEKKGALLKVQFEDCESVGYADLHPLEEWGEDPVDEQLTQWKRGVPNSLVKQSLFYAHQDARARSRGENLFFIEGEEEVTLPRSHFLITDVVTFPFDQLIPLAREGFQTLKVKMGRSPQEETESLRGLVGFIHRQQEVNHFRLRLDWNQALSLDEMDQWLKEQATWILPYLDFIEDPCPWDPEVWEGWRHQYGLRLALDQALTKGLGASSSFDVMVIKPSRDPVFDLVKAYKDKDWVITHSMDHPLGQATALWVAEQLRKKNHSQWIDCGLLSGNLFESNEYFRSLHQEGPWVYPPGGTGFGFDDLLEAEPWQPLI